jgi:hypothetical protein
MECQDFQVKRENWAYQVYQARPVFLALVVNQASTVASASQVNAVPSAIKANRAQLMRALVS